MMRLFQFLLFSVIFLGTLSQPTLAQLPVTLKTKTEIQSHTIRLGDVFTGISKEMNKDIALAPDAGQSVTYDIRVLTRLAEKYGLEWTPSSYSDHTILTRAAHYLTLDEVKPEVIAKLEEQGLDTNAKYELLFDNRTLSIALPSNHTPDFNLINFLYDNRNKRFKAELTARNEKEVLKYPLTGRVIVKKQVPVLASRLKAGDIIGKRDLRWEWVQEQRLSKDIIMHKEELIGMELRQIQTEGSLLHARDVISPRLVTRGGIVTMKIQTPVMVITAQGRALQDGAKGDVVRIKNLKSNRIIEATVESSGTVLVQTSSPQHLAALH